jgi:hypothetical protein
VDKARTERAARLRRVLSRAAVVLGGAVAGTAAAWVLSMSAASADTLPQAPIQPVVPVVGTLTAPGQLPAAEIGQSIGHVAAAADAVLPEPPAPPKELGEVGKHVQGAVQQVTTTLARPVHAEHSDVTTSAGLRMLTPGDVQAPAAVLPAEAAAQPAPADVENQISVTARKTGRHAATGSSRYAPPRDQEPHLPALPPLPAPLAPPAAPAASCVSCGNGPNDDLGVLVAYTGLSSRSGLATEGGLRMVTQHVATAVGEQPGVTPD